MSALVNYLSLRIRTFDWNGLTFVVFTLLIEFDGSGPLNPPCKTLVVLARSYCGSSKCLLLVASVPVLGPIDISILRLRVGP